MNGFRQEGSQFPAGMTAKSSELAQHGVKALANDKSLQSNVSELLPIIFFGDGRRRVVGGASLCK
jgi:hypothetical protein